MSPFASRQPSCWRSNPFLRLIVGIIASYQLISTVAPAAKALAANGSANEEDTVGNVDCIYVRTCIETVKRAQRLTEENELLAALRVLQGAYDRWKSQWLLINIGRTQHRLLRPADAAATYRHYLANAPDDWPERVARARTFLQEAEREVKPWQAEGLRIGSSPKVTPVYRRSWFWGTLVGVAVVSSSVTLGFVIATHPEVLQPRFVAPPNTTTSSF